MNGIKVANLVVGMIATVLGMTASSLEYAQERRKQR